MGISGLLGESQSLCKPPNWCKMLDYSQESGHILVKNFLRAEV